jgi:UDP-N-acetylglucosamine 2-epimerase (non-hydrolysing)
LAGLDRNRPLIFVTAHRRENHASMREIALALADIAAFPERPQLLWPVHPSPQVAPVAHKILDGVPGVRLIDPIDYAELVGCVAASRFVLTDSGGLQEEAPTLGKPVLVMRDVTERPEGLAAGTLELVGAVRERIVAASRRLLTDEAAYARMARASNPYGDGHAATRIASWLLWRLRDGIQPEEFSVAASAA